MRKSTIYAIDGWEPFPSSEYGGLIVVLADSDAQAEELCRGTDVSAEFHHLIRKALRKAKRIEVETDEPPQVVAEFRT